MTPTFSWAAVEGAAVYQFGVLGPERIRWAWEGAATRVRYGGDEITAGGPRLVAGSWWNVAAVGADGETLALSDMRPVSPAAETGPIPTWVAASDPEPSAGPSEEADSGRPADPATTLACSLLTVDDIVAEIGGEWSEPEESVYPHGKGSSCDWTLTSDRFGGGVALTISAAEAYDPDGWGGEWDPMLEGIGDEAFLTRSGDRKVGWLHGSVNVTLTFTYGQPEAYETFVAFWPAWSRSDCPDRAAPPSAQPA